MKKLVRVTKIVLLLLLGVSQAEAQAQLKSSIAITGVTVSKLNAADAGMSGYRDCQNFKGTNQNNTVWIKPSISGGSGAYEHTIIWRFGAGYQNYSTGDQQFEKTIPDGNSYGITMPALREDVPYVQQSILVLSKDLHTGLVVNQEKLFTVSRNVILAPTEDVKLADQNCYQRYPAFESMIGVLSNGSTNSSNLVIKQGIDHLWNNTSGSSWGFYVSPLSFISVAGLSLGNLLSLNRNYFTSLSKQTSETVEVSTDYQLSPGDYMQIYTQKTRYVNNYDATMIDACGGTQKFPGAYKMQWWGFAYHALPINPFDPSKPNPNNIGARPVNTCPAELSAGMDQVEALPFYQTNL